tara:strand:+ start:313 stop:606 length:294 start_codon:yes stop_codon:yes gene_type:complete
MTAALQLGPTSIVVIPRGVRLHHDQIRKLWVLLAPERTINLDQTGLAILNQIDGKRPFQTIIDRLAALYDAPADQISDDVHTFVIGLMKRRILDVTR